MNHEVRVYTPDPQGPRILEGWGRFRLRAVVPPDQFPQADLPRLSPIERMLIERFDEPAPLPEPRRYRYISFHGLSRINPWKVELRRAGHVGLFPTQEAAAQAAADHLGVPLESLLLETKS